VVAMLHRLLESGLARQRDPEGQKFMPVIELTAAGIAVMKGLAEPPLTLRDIVPRRTSREMGTNPRALGTNPKALAAQIDFDADPEAAPRFQRLRLVRSRLAKELKLAPFMICHDSVLKLLAAAAPTTIN